MPQLETKKEEIYWSVLNAAILLDFKRGHMRWSMSELSRTSKVTRSLIYYYFGKSKESILLEGVKMIGEEFFGLNPARLDLWAKGKIAESVIETRRLLEKSPNMAAFYMVYREDESQFGKSIQALEREYKQKLKKFFKGSDSSMESIFGLFMGLVIAPALTDEAVHKAVKVVLDLANKGSL